MKVTITPKAVAEVRRIITEQLAEETKENEKTYLRIRVQGGGCSGFQHKLDLSSEINEKIDTVMVVEGVDVVIDKRSALYLDGVVVDFLDEINNRGFSVKNPNSKGTCGCGSSFTM
jgi:iron-sulfur cluster assembly protein